VKKLPVLLAPVIKFQYFGDVIKEACKHAIMGTAYTESGIYYIPFGRPINLAGFGPVALHVGDGSQIISQELSGDKVNVFTGASGNERYGYFEASLEQERLEGG